MAYIWLQVAILLLKYEFYILSNAGPNENFKTKAYGNKHDENNIQKAKSISQSLAVSKMLKRQCNQTVKKLNCGKDTVANICSQRLSGLCSKLVENEEKKTVNFTHNYTT